MKVFFIADIVAKAQVLLIMLTMPPLDSSFIKSHDSEPMCTTAKWNSDIINFINYTCVLYTVNQQKFPALTCQNVFPQKSLMDCITLIILCGVFTDLI